VLSLEARIAFLQKILSQVPNSISKSDLEDICRRMNDYSASDLNTVAAEACNIPVREVERYLKSIDAKHIRNVTKKDFL
jgi:SpoVK/Ycf46/Vps4 family AAA+-type ATPase